MLRQGARESALQAPAREDAFPIVLTYPIGDWKGFRRPAERSTGTCTGGLVGQGSDEQRQEQTV